jgi:hypothetical protein
MGDGNDEFALVKYFCSYLQVIFLHAVKSYVLGPTTSPTKEVLLWIFITLKNPSPLPGLNPQTLDVMASTLTITPTR